MARPAHPAPRYAGYGQPTPRDPRIQDGWFQEGWLPFAGFSAPTLMLMLDHTPTAQGEAGADHRLHARSGFHRLRVRGLPHLLAQTLEQIEEDPEDFLEG